MYQATIVHGGLDKAESRRAHIGHRRTKLWVIEEVEELGAEIQTHLSRKPDLLDDREVRVDEIGSSGWDTARVTQLAGGGRNKAGWVDPLQLAVGRIAGVATGDPVRPVPIVGIAPARERCAGAVNAVDQGHWESRRDSLDKSHLEVAENGVGHGIPIAPELLSAAEGQIVNHTAGEAVIEVDLRQAPIQVLASWEAGKRGR